MVDWKSIQDIAEDILYTDKDNANANDDDDDDDTEDTIDREIIDEEVAATTDSFLHPVSTSSYHHHQRHHHHNNDYLPPPSVTDNPCKVDNNPTMHVHGHHRRRSNNRVGFHRPTPVSCLKKEDSNDRGFQNWERHRNNNDRTVVLGEEKKVSLRAEKEFVEDEHTRHNNRAVLKEEDTTSPLFRNWKCRYEMLEEYVNSHERLPRDRYRSNKEGFALGKWVAHQKSAYWNEIMGGVRNISNRMTKPRAEWLESISNWTWVDGRKEQRDSTNDPKKNEDDADVLDDDVVIVTKIVTSKSKVSRKRCSDGFRSIRKKVKHLKKKTRSSTKA